MCLSSAVYGKQSRKRLAPTCHQMAKSSGRVSCPGYDLVEEVAEIWEELRHVSGGRLHQATANTAVF
jgi:hypothetical protein